MVVRINGICGIWVGLAALALTGCTAEIDGFGTDPVMYREEHPLKNTVETRTQVSEVRFAAARAALSDNEEANLRKQLHGISMAAVESVTVGLSKGELHNEERKSIITKLMHRLGYTQGDVMFVYDADVADNHAKISLKYAVAIPPNCPDWSASPVTTYSNTTQGNFYCAQESNIGLMVADPHDLVEGSGDVQMSTARAAMAVQNYNNGAAAPAAASSGAPGSSGSGSGGSGGAAPSPPQ
jgi:pilus biogenesis lipoprotein CpaD